MKIRGYAVVACIALCSQASASAMLFDFDNAPMYSSLPTSLTVDGLTANLSATGQGGFAFWAANVYGFTPAGFSGLSLYPTSLNSADLLVSFSQALSDFSILYAPVEYATDSSARMRVTAYMGGVYVGTNTMTADPPGTWPTATLSFSSASPFDRVVVHYDAPPPVVGDGDYVQIFAADNMQVTAAVPEPATWAMLIGGLALLGVVSRRRFGRTD